MQINALCPPRQAGLTKIMRIMRLTALLLSAFCLQVSAEGLAQTITFSGKNVPLEKVFREIREQTGYYVVWNYRIMQDAKPVTVAARNEQVERFVQEVLKDQPLEYYIEHKTIIIRRKPQTVLPVKDTTAAVSGITVRGRILGTDGEPLPGATIRVRGVKKGTSTNANGTFTLHNVDENAILDISFVGFESKAVPVEGRDDILLVMKRSENPLDIIQVEAYRTNSRRLSTGNINTVKAADIETQPVSNPLLALQGRVPGIFIEQTKGLPGTGVKVRIQGQNSLNRGSDPLYVVDGVPYPSQLLSSLSMILGGSGSGPAGNPLSFINPGDIESIDVLKDADATSIYGSRAAAGAILITTKKGKAGQTGVNANVQHGWGKITRKIKMLNTQQYIEMRKEALQNDGIATPSPTDYDINGTWDQDRYTDWQKVVVGGTARYTNAQATVSGGTGNTSFLAGGNYHRETTVFPGDHANESGTFHFNLNNTSANQKFRFTLSGNYVVNDNQLPFDDFTTIMWSAPNTPELYNEDGSLNWEPDEFGHTTFYNPLARNYFKYRNKTNNLLGNAVVSYEILPGLQLRSSFGYNSLITEELMTRGLLASDPEMRLLYGGRLRSAQYADASIKSWIIEPQINYVVVTGKGTLDFLLGSTFNKITTDREQLSGSIYASDEVMEDIRAAGVITVNSTTASVYKYNALFGRLNYNLQDKYIFNLTARRDGSSRFGPENLFHNFASVAGAWIFSGEPFFERHLPALSFGKLRISFGSTGNDQIGEYQFMDLYDPVNSGIPYQGAIGLRPTRHTNPYLQWEETRKLQAGLDLGFFHDRVLLSASYFRNRSSNQLGIYDLPIFTGFSGIDANFPAVIQNYGWELSFNTRNIERKNFKWSSAFNITLPRNKLVAFPGLETSPYASWFVIGKPFTINKKYRFGGVDPATGVYQFVDQHGNLTSAPTFTDRTVTVNTAPEFYGGLQNSFELGSFSVELLFQFVKQKGNDGSFGGVGLPGVFYGNQPPSVLDRWQKPGDKASVQRFNSNYQYGDPFFNAIQSDAAFGDASYARLKNASVSWQLPAHLAKKMRLTNCRIYAYGQNVFTITRYKGSDPETRDPLGVPPLRVFTFGIQLGI